MQVGVDAKVLIQFVRTIHSYNMTGPETGLNITRLDTADVQSRVQVGLRGLHHKVLAKEIAMPCALCSVYVARVVA